jgi:hypothetical protein
MSWRKHFQPVPTSNNPSGSYSPFTGRVGNTNPGPAKRNYSSYLPDVYVGTPNRIERYGQYNTMDIDSEVNAALDILAEFCTQKNEQNGTPFNIKFKSKASRSEIIIISKYLQQWCKLQKFDTRMFRILRNVFKYGDQFFIRDPETKKWFHVDPASISRIIVNESEGKIPEQYIVRNFNLNFKDMVSTTPHQTVGNITNPGGANYQTGGARGMVGQPFQTYNGSRFQLDDQEVAVDAKHIIHLSLSEGLDLNYPFGNSLLESIFKVYKQKELLEDSIIIYRVQRAPERRVFYVDVGNMPTHLAMQFVERVKTEIHQRRIPSSNGGGQNLIDSAYNPLCLDLETKIPLLDGRTLSLDNLIKEFEQGKENWAYSCNPVTGKVVPGVINWAGVTRKNTEVIKLTLDNGKTFVCTPDHKIPVFGKGFVEAKDITPKDSLISFEKRNQKISNNSNDYEQVWDHSTKTWTWTHRTVAEFFRKINKHQEFTFLKENMGKEKTVVHHKDYNRFNNDPRNLQYMNKADHILYHASMKEDFWKNISKNDKRILSEKISNTLKTNWKNFSEGQRQSALYNIREAQKKSVWMRLNDPLTKSSYKKNQSISRKKYMNQNPHVTEMLIRNLQNRVKIKNQELNLTFEMLQIVVDIVRTESSNKNRVIEICDNNQELLNLIKKENSVALDYKNAHCKIDFNKFGYSKLNRLIKKYGYKNWKNFVKSIDQFNHKVVKIEKVENRDTGTITIDGTERWHDYHTFAIDSGIFVKNSVNEDYFFPQTCLALDQKIKLLDGRDLSLLNIIEEFDQGKANWTYTVNQQTQEIEPGKIVWAGKTRLNTQLMEVLLDNGEKIKVTPDHRFIMRDGSETEAQNLQFGDSLMPLYLHDARTGKHQGADKYLKYTCNATGKKKWVHTMVCPKSKAGKDTEIHHIDCNSLNNNPTNLVEMDTKEHRQLHKILGTYHLSRAWKNSDKRQKLLEGIRQYHANATDKDKEMFANRGRINGKNTWKNKNSAKKVLKSLEQTRKKVSQAKTIQISDDMCARVVELYNEGYNSISKLTKKLKTDNKFQLAYIDANQNILRDKNRPNTMLPTDTSLRKIAAHMGYKDWKDFKESYAPNHKVISVTWLDQTEDTGDITIESASNGHNFALTAGVFIHNSEGRGSKVETLPGGTNLGEIDDLRYFTNKLVRGLRIPSSYLPTGADDSAAQYNDGRVGTAYIQELRFNTYCERLQGLVCEQFDQEFKRYLLEKGVNIDTAMFDITFQPPQNFAAYRQSEIDNARVPTFSQMSGIPYISNRFALKRFLGMTDEEIAENERLWREENDETFGQNQPTDAAGEMRAGGISGAGIDADLGAAEGDMSAEDAGIDTGPGSAPGSTPAPGAQTTPGV